MTEKTIVISRTEQLLENSGRRQFLKVLGMGGAIIFMPSILASCSNDNNNDGITGPGTGGPLVIDFAKGDIAVFQFAYALEQLEADFYTKVVANFNGADFTAADQAILADIKNHEIIHRETLKAVLGPSNGFSVNTTYGSLNFKSRAQVLAAARDFEDLGVTAYNGAAQYIASGANLLAAGKIVSVEARHASAIRDLIAPKSSGDTSFAPKAFDDVFSPGKVRAAAQNFVVETIQFANAPSTFVQGPNGNG